MTPLPQKPVYYQERIVGLSLAAVFVGRRNGAMLAGVTRQWLGRPGAPFAYVGSVGPWPLAPRERARVEGLGHVLASAFGLVGLFGVDLVLRDGEPWPVEVNPRYTASVEVLELALGRALLDEHRRACDPCASVQEAPAWRGGPAAVGKLIVFAPTCCRFPDFHAGDLPGGSDPFCVPGVADVPEPGAVFEPGAPILTLLAGGPSPEDCVSRLTRRRAEWEGRLGRGS